MIDTTADHGLIQKILDGLQVPTWQQEPTRDEVLKAAEASVEGRARAAMYREAHRLRPLSQWTKAEGAVIRYQVRPDGTIDQLGAGWIYSGGGTTHWLPLPDLKKLWVEEPEE